MNRSILYVANLEQKLIFLNELRGQLSDGYWEGSKPRNHWVPWSSLNWNTVQIPLDGKVGVSGDLRHTDKNNYDFASAELYKYVGIRMRMLVAIYRCFSFELYAKKASLDIAHTIEYRNVVLDALKEGTRLPESYQDWLEVIVNATEPMSTYWKETKQNWHLLGLDRESIRLINSQLDEVYSKEELMKDLQMLKLAFRTPR
jgi:hypothetical protein